MPEEVEEYETLGEVLSRKLAYQLENWKSTAKGLLQFLQTTLTVISGWQAVVLVSYPNAGKTWLMVSVGCTLATSLTRAWIGVLEKDAK